MSTTTKYELLQALRAKCKRSRRHQKKLLLEEFCSICGYNHKYAIRLFNSCSKRLKAILALWLPFYDKTEIPEPIRAKLLSISPATIDRLMSHLRKRFGKLGLSTTKPGSLIKKHIPVKTSQWDESMPGFLEADTVAHCGNSVAGMFVYTVNTVDIASQ